MIFKNMKDLEKYVNSKIKDALSEDVAEIVKERMKLNIKTEVYDKYNPKVYERRYDEGGLVDEGNIISKVTKDNTLIVENITMSNEDYLPKGKKPFQIAGVIEYGHNNGYGEYDYPTDMRFLKPRPFLEETRKDLRENGQHIDALKRGLKSRGINVE